MKSETYKIVKKEKLAPEVFLFEVEAPLVARKHQAGQFVIFVNDEKGERIPYTIFRSDRERGTITVVVQVVGRSTMDLCYRFNEGDGIYAVVGPLGRPTHIEKYGAVVCVAGGIGVAPIYPIARALKEAGNKIVNIIGARSKDLLILTKDMEAISDEVVYTTDDGSFARKGFVTDALKDLLKAGRKFNFAVTIGPAIMMKFVSAITKEHNIPTIVSLNSIMIDGTGMCGCCRITSGGKSQFACVDGPEFDAHQVDFDELIRRQGAYGDKEKCALEASPIYKDAFVRKVGA